MTAAVREGREKAAALGYADGIADTMALGISTYRAAVFPLSGSDAGTPPNARRAVRPPASSRHRAPHGTELLTAADGLPHHIRAASATALKAIDGGRDRDTDSAVEDLMKAVQKQRRSM